MTFLEMCQAVVSEGGISNDVAPTTVTGQVDQLARVVNWVSRAWVEIQEKHIDWDFLRVEDVATTTPSAGQYIYTPDDFGIVDGYSEIGFNTGGAAAPAVGNTLTQGAITGTIKKIILQFGDWGTTTAIGKLILSSPSGNFAAGAATITGGLTCTLPGPQQAINFNSWAWGSFRVYNTTDGTAGETLLTPRTYPYMRDVYLFGGTRDTRTRPDSVSAIPSNHSVVLGPIPDDGYTVTADFYKQPIVLAADGDIPDVHPQHHMIIVYRALWKYGLYESAGEMVSYARSEYEPKLYAMNREFRPVMRLGGSLA